LDHTCHARERSEQRGIPLEIKLNPIRLAERTYYGFKEASNSLERRKTEVYEITERSIAPAMELGILTEEEASNYIGCCFVRDVETDRLITVYRRDPPSTIAV